MESWESDVGELKKNGVGENGWSWRNFFVEKEWECLLPLSNMKELSRNFKEEETSLKRFFLTFDKIAH